MAVEQRDRMCVEVRHAEVADAARAQAAKPKATTLDLGKIDFGV